MDSTCQIQTGTAEVMPSEHTSAVYTMPFLINFLNKKCHADIRYERCRLLILHKIIDPSAGLVEICDLTDVYEFAWCRDIINLVMMDPQDT